MMADSGTRRIRNGINKDYRISPGVAKEIVRTRFNLPDFPDYIDMKRVIRYAHDMMIGYWAGDGDPIIIDQEGIMQDGWHRMFAVALLGEKVRMHVNKAIPKI